MATALTLPIARLRAAGCKVSTVIGHDPAIGDFIYSVTLPEGVQVQSTQVHGHATQTVLPSERRIIVRSCGYRLGLKTPQSVINDRGLSAAATLRTLADYVESETQS